MMLRGRAGVVTGGGRGIGLHIARALAKEGMDLVLAARTQPQLDAACSEISATFPVRCLAQRTDVSLPAEVAALAERARRELGRVDLLVNNAGIYGPIGPLAEADPEEWRHAIEVNLLGTVWCSRAMLPFFRAQGGGKVINLAGAGVGGPSVTPRISAYAASKAAVVQFTESLARELAAANVQVNAIAPGAVATEITAAVVAAGPEKAGKDFYERSRKQLEEGGDPPQLAARLAVWLASDAPGKLTGKLLSAKWDQVEMFDAEAVNRSSLYTLRRIDGVLFNEVVKK